VAATDDSVTLVAVRQGSRTGAVTDRASADEAAPFVVEQIRELQGKVDAIVIGCFCDPGLVEGRKVSNEPIFGAAESTMNLAGAGGIRFSVVTVCDPAHIEAIAVREGLANQLVSVHRVTVPIRQLRSERKRLLTEAVEFSNAAVERGADAVCLGCCSFDGLGSDVEASCGVPVLEPKRSTFKRVASVMMQV
jgi:allantoin racemase